MLRPRKHITRREIKEDTLVTVYFKVRKFIQKHSRYLNIGLLAIPVIVIVAVLMVRSKRNAEFNAAEQLSVAEQSYQTADYSTSIDALAQIINGYPGTRAAGEAAFYLGNVYFLTEDYNQAEKYYQLYINDYTDHDLYSVSSMAGIAACYENQGRFIDAALQYEKAANRYDDLFYVPFYLKDTARCYALAGENEKAKRVYQTVLDQYPESNLQEEIEFILQTL